MEGPVTGVWQLRRIGGPASVQNSSSLITLKEDGSVSVGRGPKADYFLDSAVTSRLISRIHALVTGRMGKDGTPSFTIVNNGLNGTYINDVKMGYRTTHNEKVLQEGDKITFGHPGCASIEPGEYAPQENSEFMFIFECVPVRCKSDGYLSKTAIKYSPAHSTHQKHTSGLPNSLDVHNTHVSGYQRDRYSITSHEPKQHTPQFRITCSKTSGSDCGPDSPKSSASSEKENDGTVGHVTSAADTGGGGDSVNAINVYRTQDHSCKYCCVSVSPGSGIFTSIRCSVCDAKSKSKWVPDHEGQNAAWTQNFLLDSIEIKDTEEEPSPFESGTEHKLKTGLNSKATSLHIGHNSCWRPLRNGTPMSGDENYVSSTNQNKTPDRNSAITGCSANYSDRIPPSAKPHNQLQTLHVVSEVNSTTLVSEEEKNCVSDDSDIEIDVIRVDDDEDLESIKVPDLDWSKSPVVEYLGETGPTMPLRMVIPPDLTSVDKESSISTTTPAGSESADKCHSTSPSSPTKSLISSKVISPTKELPKDNKRVASEKKKAPKSQAMQPAIFPIGNHVRKTESLISVRASSIQSPSQTSKFITTKSDLLDTQCHSKGKSVQSPSQMSVSYQSRVSTTIHDVHKYRNPSHLGFHREILKSSAVSCVKPAVSPSVKTHKLNTSTPNVLQTHCVPSSTVAIKHGTPISISSGEKCSELSLQNPGLSDESNKKITLSASPKENSKLKTNIAQGSNTLPCKQPEPTNHDANSKTLTVSNASLSSPSRAIQNGISPSVTSTKHCKSNLPLKSLQDTTKEHHHVIHKSEEHLMAPQKEPFEKEITKSCGGYKDQNTTPAGNVPKTAPQKAQSNDGTSQSGPVNLSTSPVLGPTRVAGSPTINETVVRLSTPRTSSCSSSSGLDIPTADTHLSHHQHHLHHLPRRHRNHQQHQSRRNSSQSSESAPSSRSSSETSCDRRSSMSDGSHDNSVQSFSRGSNHQDFNFPKNVGNSVSHNLDCREEDFSRLKKEDPSAPTSKTGLRDTSCQNPKLARDSHNKTSTLPRHPTLTAMTRSPSQSSEASIASSTSSSASSSSGSSSSSSSSSMSSSSSSSSHRDKNPPLSCNSAKTGMENTNPHKDKFKPCLTLERRLHTSLDTHEEKRIVEDKRSDKGGGGTSIDSEKKVKETIPSPKNTSNDEPLDMRLKKDGQQIISHKTAVEVTSAVKEESRKSTKPKESLDRINEKPSMTQNKMETSVNKTCTCRKEQKNPKDSRRCNDASHRVRPSKAEDYTRSNHARYNKVRTEMDVAEMARLARSSTIIVDTSPRPSSPSSPVCSDAGSPSLSSLSSTSSSSSSASSLASHAAAQAEKHKAGVNPTERLKPSTGVGSDGEAISLISSHHHGNNDKEDTHSKTTSLPQTSSTLSSQNDHLKSQNASKKATQNGKTSTEPSAKQALHLSNISPIKQGTHTLANTKPMSPLSIDVSSSNHLSTQSGHMTNAAPNISPTSSVSSSSSSSSLSSPASLPSPACSTSPGQAGNQQRQNVISPSKRKRIILPPRKYVPPLLLSPVHHTPTRTPNVTKPSLKPAAINPKPEKLSPKQEKPSPKPCDSKDISPKTQIPSKTERQTSGPFEPSSASSLQLLSFLSSSSKKLNGPSSPLSLNSDKSGSLPSSPVMHSSQSSPPPLDMGPIEPPSTQKSLSDLSPPKLEPEIWGLSQSDRILRDIKQVKPSSLKHSSSSSKSSSTVNESTSGLSTNSSHPKTSLSTTGISALEKKQGTKLSKKVKQSSKLEGNSINQPVEFTSSMSASSSAPKDSLSKVSNAQLKQTEGKLSRTEMISDTKQAKNRKSAQQAAEKDKASNECHTTKLPEQVDEEQEQRVRENTPKKSKTGSPRKKIQRSRGMSPSTLPAVKTVGFVYDDLSSSPTPVISLSRLSESEVLEASSPRRSRASSLDKAEADSLTNAKDISSPSPSPLPTKFKSNTHKQEKIQPSSSQLVVNALKHLNCKTRPFPSKVKKSKAELHQASHTPSTVERSEFQKSNTAGTKREDHDDTSGMRAKKVEGLVEKTNKNSDLELSFSTDTKMSLQKPKASKLGNKTDKISTKKEVKLSDSSAKGIDQLADKVVAKEQIVDIGSKPIEASEDDTQASKPKSKPKKAEKNSSEPDTSKKSRLTDDLTVDLAKKDQDDTGVKPTVQKQKTAEKIGKKNFGSIRKTASTSAKDVTKSAPTRLSLFECLEMQAQQTKAQRRKRKNSDKSASTGKTSSNDTSVHNSASQKSLANKIKPEPKRQQNTPRRNSGRLSVASVSSEDAYNFGSQRRYSRSRTKDTPTTPAKKKRKPDDSISAERKTSEETKPLVRDGVRTKAGAKAAAASKKMLTEKDVMMKKNKATEKSGKKNQQKRKIATSEEEEEEEEIEENPSPPKKKRKQVEETQKKTPNKKKPTRKRKRAMTFSSGDEDDTMNDLSDDESELDDIVDNIEDYNTLEEEGESEDWDLPEGVNYDDTPCSAPRCRNPIGERVDWVMCDSCELWYHVACVNCSLDQLEDDNIQFHCGFC